MSENPNQRLITVLENFLKQLKGEVVPLVERANAAPSHWVTISDFNEEFPCFHKFIMSKVLSDELYPSEFRCYIKDNRYRRANTHLFDRHRAAYFLLHESSKFVTTKKNIATLRQHNQRLNEFLTKAEELYAPKNR